MSSGIPTRIDLIGMLQLNGAGWLSHKEIGTSACLPSRSSESEDWPKCPDPSQTALVSTSSAAGKSMQAIPNSFNSKTNPSPKIR